MGVMCMSDRDMSDREGKHDHHSNHRSDRQRKPSRRRSDRHQYPERGWIEFLILRMIHENPMHGYQLMEEIETRGFVLSARLESGAVYTILRRMESRGLLTSRWEKIKSRADRRVYQITDEGIKALKTGLETIVRRQSLMENLVTYYNEQFKSDESENS